MNSWYNKDTMEPFDVIFLDVDGVLNTHADPDKFVDAQKIALLKRIVDETNAKIVLSSSWKIGEGFELIKAVLFSHKLEIYDVTPTRFTSTRNQEINQYFLEHKRNIRKFVILDDLSHAAKNVPKNRQNGFFKTDPFVGLTEEIANKVIAYLKEE